VVAKMPPRDSTGISPDDHHEGHRETSPPSSRSEEIMSTPQSVPLSPRVRIGLGTTLTALGVILAVAVAITILALTSADQTTVATPPTVSQAASGSAPQVHYLGPRQERAISRQGGGGITPTAGAGNAVSHYSWLGAAQRDLR
jgi:hypothetical protein